MAETYQDADIYGRELTDGNPVEHLNAEAIKNALILFLTSKKGDFIRNPDLGGPLDRVIFKSLNGNIIPLITFTIKNAIINHFSPAIKLRDIRFEPDYVNKIASITIIYSTVLSDRIEEAQLYINDVLTVTQQFDQNVTYTGENLKIFCLIQKPSMGKELLLYNEFESQWMWGKFIFLNFSESDPEYDNILAICNS